MNLSNIIILKDHLLLEPVIKPSNLTLTFLTQILHSDFFKSEAEYLEEEVLSWKRSKITYKHIHVSAVQELYKFVKSDLEYLTSYYDLPYYFTRQFFYILYCKCFIEIYEEDGKPFYLDTPAEIQNFAKDIEEEQQNYGALIFPNEVTKKDLHKYIDDEWEHINREMKQHLPVFPSITKFTNMIIADEIYSLHNKGTTYKEISEYLCSKYPDNNLVYDESWIKTKLSRFKNRINKFDKEHYKED